MVLAQHNTKQLSDVSDFSLLMQYSDFIFLNIFIICMSLCGIPPKKYWHLKNCKNSTFTICW